MTSWRSSAMIWMLAGLAQCLPLLQASPVGTIDWELVTEATGLAMSGVLLICGLVTYAHWRMTRWRSSAVSTLGLIAGAIHLLASTLALLSLPGGSGGVAPWLMAAQALLVTLAALALHRCRSWGASRDPAVAGLVAGLAAAAVCVVVTRVAPPIEDDPLRHDLLLASLVTSYVLLVLVVLHELGATAWVSARLATAVALLGLGQVLVHLPDDALSSLVLVGANAVGSALLLTTVLALLVRTAGDDQRALLRLQERLDRVERGADAERATLHEIRATMGGIAAASRLVHGHRLGTAREAALTRMIDSELGRLGRLMDARPDRDHDVVDVDSTLEPIVLRQTVRGQDVLWRRTGHNLATRGDDLAEIVHILLENSRRHAAGATTCVEVELDDGGRLVVRVCDNGPGVAADARAAVFEWGARRPGSPGQGIGLHVARRLARDLGGDVVLVESRVGATFTLTLPGEGIGSGRSRASGPGLEEAVRDVDDVLRTA